MDTQFDVVEDEEEFAVAPPPPPNYTILKHPRARKTKHRVADIHYGREDGDVSYSTCTCGESFVADDPEQMSHDYARHIEESGVRRPPLIGWVVVAPAPAHPEPPERCPRPGCEFTYRSCVQHNPNAGTYEAPRA